MATSTQTSQPFSDSNSQTSPQRSRATGERDLQPGQDIVAYVRDYARQKPDVTALWCFGLGIVVGWKIKPW